MKFNKIILILFLTFVITNASSQEKLVFAIDLIRHGDRTPIHSIPKSPHYWAEGMGQLTSEGMREEYQLGTQLRKKYIDQYHLLSPYYKNETIYIRSTDYDRTLMSAASLLMGLYPLGTGPALLETKQFALPHAYQPIPIHTMPKEHDATLIPSIDRKKNNKLFNKYVFTRADWKEKNTQLKSRYAAWSAATGVTIKSLDHLSSLGSTLYINQLHHVPQPTGLDAEDINDIIKNGKWVIAAKYRPKEVGREVGNKLLILIADYLEQSIKHVTQLKYVLLSGHDTTILSVMSAMQAPLVEPPPFASNLNFSLYEISPRHYLIKVSFNGQSVNIPGCKGSFCTLQQFRSMIS